MKKPHLVPDWRDSWRWFSVQAFALLGAAGPVWALIPEQWRSAVPTAWLGWAAAILAVVGILGRVVDQKQPAKNKNTQQESES